MPSKTFRGVLMGAVPRRIRVEKSAKQKPRVVKVYVDLDVEEVSGVDVPAQGKASVVQKRLPLGRARTLVEKAACMTVADKSDHAHLITGHDDQAYGQTTSTDSENGWHSHPWVKKGGKIMIGAARGHTHSVDAEDLADNGADEDLEDASGRIVKKADAEAQLLAYHEACKRKYTADQLKQMVADGEAMPGGRYPIKDAVDLEDAIHAWGRTPSSGRAAVASWIKRRARALGKTDKLPTAGPLAEALGNVKAKKNDDTPDHGDPVMAMTDTEQKEFDEAKAEAARWRTLASEITVEEREYAKRLEPEPRAVFFRKSAAERKAELELDVEVYKSPIDGRVFRKSHNPEMVEAMKRADSAQAEVNVAKAEARKLRFAKRAADELPYLPGTAEERARVFEYADTLPKEDGEKFIATMKSASNANREKFVTLGTTDGGDGDAGTAEGRYNVAAKKFADEKKMTVQDATEDFLSTAEGVALYREMQAEKRSVSKVLAAAKRAG